MMHLNITQDLGHGFALIFICFLSVFFAVVIDLFVKLVAEYKLKRSIESKKLRKSVIKLILYHSTVLYGVLIDVVGLAFTWYDIPYCAILFSVGVLAIEGKSMWETHEEMNSSVVDMPDVLKDIIGAATKKDAEKILELLKKDKENDKK